MANSMNHVELFRLIQETADARDAYNSDDTSGVISALTATGTPVERMWGVGHPPITSGDVQDLHEWELLAQRLVTRFNETIDKIHSGTITSWDQVTESIDTQ